MGDSYVSTEHLLLALQLIFSTDIICGQLSTRALNLLDFVLHLPDQRVSLILGFNTGAFDGQVSGFVRHEPDGVHHLRLNVFDI